MSTSREQIERSADRIREELVTTLHELDRRREAVTDWKGQLEAHLGWVVGVGAGALVLGAGAIVFSRVRAKNRGARLRKERVRSFLRAWEHPRRLAASAPQRTVPSDLGRRFLKVFGGVLVTAVARRAGERLWELGVQGTERREYATATELPTS